LLADTGRSLRILQISTTDIGGGAEKVAWDLFQEYRARGHDSWLAVGSKRGAHPDVLLIQQPRSSGLWRRMCMSLAAASGQGVGRIKGAGRVQRFFEQLAEPSYLLQRVLERELGREALGSPATWRLLDLPPEKPDLIHCHNLHGSTAPGGGYFDLRALPWLSQHVPVVLTLHDAWLLSGHCAHSFDCERWRTGCGRCPDLSIYPAIRRDATAGNWRRKRAIYRRSRLYLTTPSRWLMDKVQQSMLATAIVEARVIPNGVDLSLFRPGSKEGAREDLGLPQGISILLFTANGIRRNMWKDYATLRQALGRAAEALKKKQILLVALGEDAPAERIGPAEIRFIPHKRDPAMVAGYYRAADVYVHAAKVDTFPNAVLEALACGTPVVATAVGGIPEQIQDGMTGYLTPRGNSEMMADRIVSLLTDRELRGRMGAQAAEVAQRQFDLNRQVDRYLAWYQEVLAHDARCALRDRESNHALPNPE
jgi:glycosyltransferase involved in cell wall biosynthesis